MPISETITYIIIFALTIIFTVFALTLEKNRLLLKMSAGLCWFILALVTLITNTTFAVVPIALTFLFGGFGVIFFISTVDDWAGEKKDSFYKEIES